MICLLGLFVEFISQDKSYFKSTFNQYFNEYKDDILEITNKLNGMYLVSGTKLLHDFIELIPVNFPIFNFADIAINIAVICLLLETLSKTKIQSS